MIESLMNAMELMGDADALVERIESKEAMLMLFGTMIDSWTARHNLSVEEAKGLVKTLCELHTQVNDEIGGM